MKHFLVVATLMGTTVLASHAQQVADTGFRPPIERPAYPARNGPVVLIDEAHRNFHTATGRYLPFAELLRRDGYIVKPSAAPFTVERLRAGRLLVMSNATETLTAREVAAVRDWVAGGGSLLLIADHSPFSEVAADLGKAFGIRFRNGLVMDVKATDSDLVFRKVDGTLVDHSVTKGVDQVATFGGSSFRLDAPGQPLLVFGPELYSFSQQNDPNPVPVQGHLQGALLPFGKGRVAVFGEAAMFSAQLAGPDKASMGMNAPIAKQNPQFLLNVIHWLTTVGNTED